MGVEAREHAVQRVLDQVAVAHRLDIFGAHAAEDVAEQRQQPVGLGAAAIGLGEGADNGAGHDAGGEGPGDGEGDTQLGLHAQSLIPSRHARAKLHHHRRPPPAGETPESPYLGRNMTRATVEG